jgi:putative ABC transporter-associated repeat protein
VVISSGHVDLGPRLVDDKWTVQIRDDTADPVVWRRLNDVILEAIDGAKIQVPADTKFSFLGQPGSDVWILPQTQRAGVLWPGWNTQDESIAGRVNGQVTWRLLKVDGPGAFTLYLTGSFGEPTVLFGSDRPFPQSMSLDINTHVHGNWAFTRTGTYHLSIEMEAVSASGRRLVDRETLTFQVGEAAAATAASGGEPLGSWPLTGLVVALVAFAGLAASFVFVKSRGRQSA